VRQTLAVALMQLRLVFKSRSTVLSMFLLPLLLTMIFGMTSADENENKVPRWTFPVAVMDSDNSFASQQLIASLEANEDFIPFKVTSQAEIRKLFSDKKAFTGLVIPAGFAAAIADGSEPVINVILHPGGNLNVGVGPFIQRETNRLVQDLRLARAMVAAPTDDAKVQEAYAKVTADRKTLDIGTTSQPVQRVEVKKQSNAFNVGTLSMGFTVMFVMMMVMMNSGVILQERERGTWGRLLTTPTNRVTLLSGYVLGFFLTGMVQFVILVIAGKLLYKINFGPLPQLFVVASALILCSVGMGMFLAGIVKTRQQQTAIGVLFVNVTSMLGGLYWPIEYSSEVMQRIAYMTPQAWAMDAFREIMLRTAEWSALLYPLLVLIGITVIFLGAGLLRVRYE